ncbi:MAG: hypothetical protein U0M47_10470 [Merdibacter sp.]|nr:hypothetical protein [Merdibacter sp.]HIY90789.1 hypothetical protein [Candidatus Merdibacter merdipullorum]
MVKCEVIGYTPKAQEMADKIERRANEMASEGYALISCAMTPAASAILVFQTRELDPR